MNYYTDKQAREFAKDVNTVWVKIDGGGEEKRVATKSASALITDVIYGTLLAISENIGNDNKFTRSGYINGSKKRNGIYLRFDDRMENQWIFNSLLPYL